MICWKEKSQPKRRRKTVTKKKVPSKKMVYDNKAVKDVVVCHLLDGANLEIPLSIFLTLYCRTYAPLVFVWVAEFLLFFNPFFFFLFLLFKCSNLRPLLTTSVMHRSNLKRKKGKNIRHAILSRLNAQQLRGGE